MKTDNKWIKFLNLILICPFCVYNCKGKPDMGLCYLATAKKHKNKLICGRKVI